MVVDDDCDPQDYHEVAFRAFGNVDYAHDLLLTQGPVDHLDHASYQQFWGGKAGIDATRKLPTEGYTRGWPEEAVMSPEVVAKVDKRWKEYGLSGWQWTARVGVRPAEGVPAAGRDRALGVRAAVRLPVRADRDDRSLGRVDWSTCCSSRWRWSGARTFAMAANRIIDRHIDARNPRTAQRELVTGAVRVRTAWTGAAVALVVFLAAAAALNPLCLVAAPLAVMPLVVYPYAKRFTNWPHADPRPGPGGRPGRRLARGHRHFAGSGPAWVLGVAVGLWIGGFDLIYACQDAEVDRQIGVRSVPARYGVPFALHLSTVVHVVTFGLFVWFGVLVGPGLAVVDRPGADRGRLRLPARHRHARPTCPG